MTSTQYLSIEVHGLLKRFPGITAVDGIDLQVSAGEFYGFLGPNGAGKTTTIQLLSGLLQPTDGKIKISGYDLETSPLEVKRRIGVLSDEPALYDRLSAQEYLHFSGQMYGLSIEEVAHRTEELLRLMELTTAKDRLIIDYSMGMKKKTALAASLLHNPKVLFLDEPFNGIDPISGRMIRNILMTLTRRGTTVFFTSHVMEVVERLCTRMAIINQGKIVGEGTIGELRRKAKMGDESSLESVFVSMVNTQQDDSSLSWL